MDQNQRITGSFTRRIDNLYGCLILIFINMAGCGKQKAPRIEPDPIPACFQQEDPLSSGPMNYPEEIPGIKIQGATSYSCAVLAVIARLYYKEITSDQNAGTLPLATIIKKLNANKNVTSDELTAFKNTLLAPYNTSINEENVANCLLEMHKIIPFLGQIIYATDDLIDAHNRPLDPLQHEIPDDKNDPIYLLNIPIVDNPAIREVSALIASHRKSKSKEKNFKQLPDKLAISLTAEDGTNPKWNDQYQLSGTAPLTIQHDLDRPDSTQSKFDLKGFIAVTLKAPQDKKTTTSTKPTEDSEEAEDNERAIAFLIIDKQWYCTNNGKLTPITREDALKASQKGTLFFYEKIT